MNDHVPDGGCGALRSLLVTEYSPLATRFGAEQRSHLMWRALSRAGSVDVLMVGTGPRVTTRTPEDARIALEANYPMLPGAIDKFRASRAYTDAVAARLPLSRYDVICVRHLAPAAKLVMPRGVPVVVDLDDVGFVYASDGSPLGRLAARAKAWAKHRIERQALRRFDRFWFVCERDRAAFAHLPGDVLPNVPLVATPAGPIEPGSRLLLFVGALWYGPNVEGVDRLLARCWPAVRAAVPDAELAIVGAGPKERLAAWGAHPGVRAVGFVDDVAPWYARCAGTVVPIYSGGGTNIKVLESLAHGRPCVTTAFCAQGFAPRLVPGRDFLVAEDDDAFVRGCLAFLRDPPQRDALASRGQASVRDQYSVQRFEQAVLDQVRLAVDAMREVG